MDIISSNRAFILDNTPKPEGVQIAIFNICLSACIQSLFAVTKHLNTALFKPPSLDAILQCSTTWVAGRMSGSVSFISRYIIIFFFTASLCGSRRMSDVEIMMTRSNMNFYKQCLHFYSPHLFKLLIQALKATCL